MSYKHEHINGSYTENGKEYPYSLEVIIRDDTGRNDTFEVAWEDATPENAEAVEEKLVDEYFAKQGSTFSDESFERVPINSGKAQDNMDNFIVYPDGMVGLFKGSEPVVLITKEQLNIISDKVNSSESAKLEQAIQTIISALTCTWEDNGNIMADAVRDNVLNKLADVTGKSFGEIENIVDEKVSDSQ